jgi:hypothetical protein
MDQLNGSIVHSVAQKRRHLLVLAFQKPALKSVDWHPGVPGPLAKAIQPDQETLREHGTGESHGLVR